MASQLTIQLPKDTPQAEVGAIEMELKQLAGVKGAGVYTPKGGALADPMIWLKASEIIVPLILKIVDALRKRRIEKATIELPNGAKLETDKATAEEIQRLMSAVGKASAQPS
jgi:hypothetical protein